jgi:nucleoid-associated protein YgaU
MSKELQIAGALVVVTFAMVVASLVAGGGKPAQTDSFSGQPVVAANDNGLPSIDPMPGVQPEPQPTPLPVAPPTVQDLLPIGGQPVAGTGPVATPPVLDEDLFGPIPTIPTPVQPGDTGTPLPGGLPGGSDPAGSPVAPAGGGTVAATTHVIAKGETLGDISTQHYGTSKKWKLIQDANAGLDPSRLKEGQNITIPAAEAGAQPAVASNGKAEGSTYIIRSGDSYYSIAKSQLGSHGRWREIEQLNGIPSEELHVGQKIKLPSRAFGKVKNANEWVVRPGDTLGDISKEHYGTTQQWQAIAEANPGVDPADLKVGTRLALPEVKADNVHVVEKGDTLGEISQQHYGTSKKWEDIVKANPGLDPERLVPGMKLIIPGKQKHAASRASADAAASSGDYVVEKGDTLGGIAAKELGSAQKWQLIADANPGIDPGNLRLGQRLRIPGRSSGPATTSAQPVESATDAGGAMPGLQGPTPVEATPRPEPIVVPPEDLFEPVPAAPTPSPADGAAPTPPLL